MPGSTPIERLGDDELSSVLPSFQEQADRHTNFIITWTIQKLEENLAPSPPKWKDPETLWREAWTPPSGSSPRLSPTPSNMSTISSDDQADIFSSHYHTASPSSLEDYEIDTKASSRESSHHFPASLTKAESFNSKVGRWSTTNKITKHRDCHEHPSHDHIKTLQQGLSRELNIPATDILQLRPQRRISYFSRPVSRKRSAKPSRTSTTTSLSPSDESSTRQDKPRGRRIARTYKVG